MIEYCDGCFSYQPEDWDVGIHAHYECESTDLDTPTLVPWADLDLDPETWEELDDVISAHEVVVHGSIAVGLGSLAIVGADLAGVWIEIDEVYDIEPVDDW